MEEPYYANGIKPMINDIIEAIEKQNVCKFLKGAKAVVVGFSILFGNPIIDIEWLKGKFEDDKRNGQLDGGYPSNWFNIDTRKKEGGTTWENYIGEVKQK